MPKWEYKVVELVKEIEKESGGKRLLGHWLHGADLEKILNRLGSQGWELVSIHLDRQEAIVVGFFKRAC